MTSNQLLPILIGFFLASIIGPRMLSLLQRLKFGQNVRDDGPKSHLKKQGTPTMGGLIFIISSCIGALIFMGVDKDILPLMLVMVGFGIIGFIDDYLKVIKKQSEGLKAYQKLVLQLIVASFYLAYLLLVVNHTTEVIIPFTYGFRLDLSYAYIPVMLIVILGTVNGVNLTDGLDGLATSVTAVIAFLYVLLGALSGYQGGGFSGLVLGSLLGFLMLNTYPAKVIMGDTGSLALGGFVAAVAIMNGLALFILLFGFVYLLESVSVILQVGYYKKTQKRLFKMAPIHHHFELSGASEMQIVVYFTVLTMVMSMISMMAL